ncbi:Protein NDUFAF4-like protein [Armadillidium vulgare]|nr:Protein NDUFAF4-like protein [Armadillidium vulgare]
MGGTASKVFRRASKPAREFNLESRVERILDREKPTPAPRHPGTEHLNLPDSAKMKKDLFETDKELLKRLEEVYVTSHDTWVGQKDSLGKSRPLPVDKETVADKPYGYSEPRKISYGKTTLKNVLTFMTDHNQSPEEWNSTKISEKFKLEKENVDHILKYYNLFTLILPGKRKGVKFDTEDTKTLGAQRVIQLPAAESKQI